MDLCQIICYRVHCCAKTWKSWLPSRSGLGNIFGTSSGNRHDSLFKLELFFREVWIILKDCYTGRLCYEQTLLFKQGEEEPTHTGVSPSTGFSGAVCPGTRPRTKSEPVELRKNRIIQKDRNINHAPWGRRPYQKWGCVKIDACYFLGINLEISPVLLLEPMLVLFSSPGTFQWMKRIELTK